MWLVNIFVLHSSSLLLLPLSLCFLFAFVVSQNSIFLCLPSTVLVCFWYITEDCSTFEEDILKIRFFLAYLPSYKMLPSRSLNKVTFALLKSKALILLFVLLPSLRVLNYTTSQSLQTRLSLTFIINQFFVCEKQVGKFPGVLFA